MKVGYPCINRSIDFQGKAFRAAAQTWKKGDGVPMVDYSSQEPGAREGRHVETLDVKDFMRVMKPMLSIDFDLMLEVKDKERSAKTALLSLSGLKKSVVN